MARVSVVEPELKFPVTAMLYIPVGVPVLAPLPPEPPPHEVSAIPANTPSLKMRGQSRPKASLWMPEQQRYGHHQGR